MRAKDRLDEFRMLSNTSESKIINVNTTINPTEEELQKVFKEIEKIQRWIKDLDEETNKMKILFSDPVFQVSKSLQSQMQSHITNCAGNGFKITGALREFQGRVKDPNDDSVLARVISIYSTSALQSYTETLKDHEACVQKYKDSRMRLLRQQINLTNQFITDEECQNLLETDNISLFINNYISDTRQAQLALQDIEARHSELLKVENALMEIKDLFVKMAALVHEQQEKINTVEYLASKTRDYVETGNDELRKGLLEKIKANKKKVLLFVILAIIFLLIFLIIIA